MKTVRFLPLQEYDRKNKDLVGIGIQVWVDPPRAMLAEFDRNNKFLLDEFNELCTRAGVQPAKKNDPEGIFLLWMKLDRTRKQDKRFRVAQKIYEKKSSCLVRSTLVSRTGSGDALDHR